MSLTKRERAMVRLLYLALDEIESELTAAGEDEVKQNPILLGKRQFVDRAKKQIKKWENE